MTKLIFPSLIYSKPLASPLVMKRLIKELKSEAFHLETVDEDGKKWSETNYPSGYTSYSSYDQLHRLSSTFGQVEKYLQKHIASFVKLTEMNIKPGELHLSSCWVNIMPPGAFHSMHLHPLSTISGTLYLDVPPKSPGIKFEDPRQGLFMASPPRKENAKPENQRFFLLQPKVGDVVLFESWMRHEVPINRSGKKRVSVSFNFDWR
ncbi:MAG: TIGR02466 family protein [Bdellovibrionota bacterium]